MNRILLTTIVLLLTVPLHADDIRFAPGVSVAATVTLKADASGVLQIDRSKPIIIGGSTATPIDPVTPDPNQTLAEYAKSAVQSEVKAYRNRDRDSLRLSHAYSEIVRLIDSGTITTSQQANDALQEAVSATLSFSLAGNRWADWRTAINNKLNTLGLANVQQVKAAYAQIADGLADGPVTAYLATEEGAAIEGKPTATELLASEAFGDGAFLKFFLEVILPLILEIIKVLS